MSTQTAGLSVLLMAVVAGVAPSQPSSMDGVWRSQGYGNVFEINGPTLKAFEVTNTTCVASGTAAVDTTGGPGRMATFKTPGASEMFVRAGGGADHKLLHREGSASDERIDRIPQLPGDHTARVGRGRCRGLRQNHRETQTPRRRSASPGC